MEKEAFLASQYIRAYFNMAPSTPLPAPLIKLRDAYFATAAIQAATHSNRTADDILARRMMSLHG